MRKIILILLSLVFTLPMVLFKAVTKHGYFKQNLFPFVFFKSKIISFILSYFTKLKLFFRVNYISYTFLSLIFIFTLSQKIYCQFVTLPTTVSGSNFSNPFGGSTGSFSDLRYQYILTAANLNTSGLTTNDILTSIGYSVSSVSSNTYPGLTISMKLTSATTLAAFDAVGLTTVHASTGTISATGWKQFPFSTNFTWDGTSNILVAVCWDRPAVGFGASLTNNATGTAGRAIFNQATTGNGCSLTGVTASANVPITRFGVQPKITSFTPSSLCASSSATVELTGNYFTAATALTIGGTAAASYTVNSNTKITATVGAGTTGSISVTSQGTGISASILTVNTLPAAVTVNSAGTYCTNTNLTASNGSDGTIYWQNTTPNGISTATPSASQLVSASTTYYFRAQSSAGCWGAQGSAAITINTPINITVSPSAVDQSTCLNGTNFGALSVTATGTSPIYQWYSNTTNTTSGGTPVGTNSNNYTPLNTTVGTLYYYCVVTSGAPCNSSVTSAISGARTVIDLPANPSNPTSNSPQCASPGVLLTSSGTAPAGENWYWQTTSTGIATTSSASTYNAYTSGTYYIRSQNTTTGCWSSGNGSALIAINPLPAAPVLSSPANAATGVSTSTTLAWAPVFDAISYDVYIGTTLPALPTANVGTNSYAIPSLLNSTVYNWKVVANNGCGAGAASSTFSFATVIPNDACANATPISCTTSSLVGTTVGSVLETAPGGVLVSGYGVWYTFTGDGSAVKLSAYSASFNLEMDIFSGSCGTFSLIAARDGYTASEFFNFTTVSGTNYYVYIAYWSTAGSATNTGPFTISMTSAPARPNITGATSICENSINNTYSVTNVAGNTYNWALPSGLVQTAGGSTNSITVTAGTSGIATLSVTATDGCGTSNLATSNIIIKSIPTAVSAGSNTTICSGANTQLTGTATVTNPTTIAFSESFSAGIPTTPAAAAWTGNINATRWTSTLLNPFYYGNTWTENGHSGNCAYFDTRDNANTVNYNLITPAIDLSTYSAATLCFWIFNSDGNDNLQVSVNNNAGGYTAIGTYYTYGSWTQITIPIPGTFIGGVNAQVRIRFRGTSDGGTSNIGIDEVSITGTSASLLPVTYGWLPNTALTDANISNPVANPTSNTEYTVTATSNGCSVESSVVVSTNPNIAASVNITASPSVAICVGESVTFNAAPTNGGTPTYQWVKNGVDISGETNATYSTNSLANSNEVSVIMTSNATPCLINASAISNTVAAVVNSPSIAGITSGDYIWCGNTSTAWSAAGNWYVYGTSYSVAAAAPTSTDNVVIAPTGLCILQQPIVGLPGSAQNISINSGASLTLNSGSTITSKNLTIASTGTLEMNSGGTSTLNVTGNWQNNGTFNAGVGTVNFNGTTAQSISKNSGNELFANVIVNNAGGSLTLTSPVEIGTNINFTSGLINSDATNLLIVKDNATATGASNNSHVVGPVQKIGDEAFTFPIGKGGNYAPAAIGAPSVTTDYFTAEYFNTNPTNASYDVTLKDNTINNISTCEYWIIDRTGGSSAVTVNLSWDTRSCGVNDPNDLLVARWDSNNLLWKDHGNGGVTVNGAAGVVTTSAVVTNFSPFTLASKTGINPLPIELTNYDLSCENKKVVINWSTASEINNNFYTIERSMDGLTFESIAFLNGHGTTVTKHNYSYTDTNPIDGISYYQLKQTDYNGQSKTYNLKSINCENKNSEVFIYPNPNKGTFVIHGTALGCDITITNILGKVIFSTKGNEQKTQVNLSDFSSGIYYITINNGKEKITKKLIID